MNYSMGQDTNSLDTIEDSTTLYEKRGEREREGGGGEREGGGGREREREGERSLKCNNNQG